MQRHWGRRERDDGTSGRERREQRFERMKQRMEPGRSGTQDKCVLMVKGRMKTASPRGAAPPKEDLDWGVLRGHRVGGVDH